MIQQASASSSTKAGKGDNGILQPRKKGPRSAILDSLHPIYSWNIKSSSMEYKFATVGEYHVEEEFIIRSPVCIDV